MLLCRCQAGWQGTLCDVPAGCSGQLDSNGTCCSGFVDRSVSEQHSHAEVQSGGCPCSKCKTQLTCALTCCRQGNCCPGVAMPDSDGQCCTGGHLDACGKCNGNATVVDLAGGYLPAVVHSMLATAAPACVLEPPNACKRHCSCSYAASADSQAPAAAVGLPCFYMALSSCKLLSSGCHPSLPWIDVQAPAAPPCWMLAASAVRVAGLTAVGCATGTAQPAASMHSCSCFLRERVQTQRCSTPAPKTSEQVNHAVQGLIGFGLTLICRQNISPALTWQHQA